MAHNEAFVAYPETNSKTLVDYVETKSQSTCLVVQLWITGWMTNFGLILHTQI